jgi:hypothetical protein
LHVPEQEGAVSRLSGELAPSCASTERASAAASGALGRSGTAGASDVLAARRSTGASGTPASGASTAAPGTSPASLGKGPPRPQAAKATSTASDPINAEFNIVANYVTAMLKGPSENRFVLKGGDAQSGTLATKYDGARPAGGYSSQKKGGAIILGTGRHPFSSAEWLGRNPQNDSVGMQHSGAGPPADARPVRSSIPISG